MITCSESSYDAVNYILPAVRSPKGLRDETSDFQARFPKLILQSFRILRTLCIVAQLPQNDNPR